MTKNQCTGMNDDGDLNLCPRKIEESRLSLHRLAVSCDFYDHEDVLGEARA